MDPFNSSHFNSNHLPPGGNTSHFNEVSEISNKKKGVYQKFNSLELEGIRSSIIRLSKKIEDGANHYENRDILNDKYELKKLQVQELGHWYQTKKEENVTLSVEVETLQRALKKSEQETGNVEKEKEHWKQTAHRLDSEFHAKEKMRTKEIETLKSTLETNDKKRKALELEHKKEVSDFEQKFKRMCVEKTEESISLKDAISKLKEEVQEKENERLKWEKSNSIFIERMKEQQKEIETRKQENDSLRNQNNSLKQEKENLETEKSSLEEEKGDLELETALLKKENDFLNERIQQFIQASTQERNLLNKLGQGLHFATQAFFSITRPNEMPVQQKNVRTAVNQPVQQQNNGQIVRPVVPLSPQNSGNPVIILPPLQQSSARIPVGIQPIQPQNDRNSMSILPPLQNER